MRSHLLVLSLLLASARGAMAEAVQFQSQPAPAALLELFTSEGCSSCPPAEAWFSRLKDDARLWKDFVPVAYHVDYWDGLGWKDSFASKAFTERQHRYGSAWRSSSVYTPGFVWNGAEWRGWFQRESLPRASSTDAGVLSARSDDAKKWALRFSPSKAGKISYTAHAALLGFEFEVNVKAGENRGRELKHDFVALALMETPMTKDGDAWRAELTLTLKPGPSPKRTALATWVTADTDVKPVQALGGWLPSSRAP